MAMMMLIHLSKCVTLVCNHIDCELSLIFFFESVVDREHAWAEALKLFSLAARGSEARRYDRLRSTIILISHRFKNGATSLQKVIIVC